MSFIATSYREAPINTMKATCFAPVHASWHPIIDHAFDQLNPDYLAQLAAAHTWLPGASQLLNAFSLPLPQVKVVLFGESPYPRAASANGYAFWDNAIGPLWSTQGLDKRVNRATSLRNFIKMLLVASGHLAPDNTSQAAIAAIDKTALVQTGHALFTNLLNHGFLLLNASLVLQDRPPQKDAREFAPFLAALMQDLLKNRSDIKLLLFGRIAQDLSPLLPPNHRNRLESEHPYNLSFIHHPEILQFFRPLGLLHTPK